MDRIRNPIVPTLPVPSSSVRAAEVGEIDIFAEAESHVICRLNHDYRREIALLALIEMATNSWAVIAPMVLKIQDPGRTLFGRPSGSEKVTVFNDESFYIAYQVMKHSRRREGDFQIV